MQFSVGWRRHDSQPKNNKLKPKTAAFLFTIAASQIEIKIALTLLQVSVQLGFVISSFHR